MNILFVVDSGVIGTNYIRNAGIKSKLKVIYITNIHNQEGDTLNDLTQDDFIQCDTENYEDVFKIISCFTHENIVGIITFVDSKLELCAKLCHQLNLSGMDPAVIHLKNKAYVNSLIPQYVPRSINFNVNEIPYEAIKKLFRLSEKRLILKPAYADGARGVSFIKTEDHIKIIDELIDLKLPASTHPDNVIVQEFLDGEVISVEGYVVNSKLVFIGATGRKKIGNTESVFIFPYKDRIPKEKYAEAKQCIRLLVEKSQYKNGFFHTEFIVSKKSIKLIDCNFGRPCGANIMEVIAYYYGIQPEEIYRQALEISLNQREIINDSFWENTKTIHALGVAYGIKKSGIVLQIKVDEELKSKHRIIQNMGCFVLEMGVSDWSWLGLLSGKEKDVLTDIEKIKIRTEFGWESPEYTQYLTI